ncbi:MAG: hypothetical protein UV78_C0002G0008 [Parcubacteria group bacterium GW2011_GWA2_43_17]|nr:MAG: hypothetical protein UV78_C0002G0008 [Parcubacteria group bacterium GW2011_GWA2_43_17]
MKKILLLLLAIISVKSVGAAVFDNFEAGLDPLKWTNSGNWVTAYIQGSNIAWSMATNEAGTGSLTSIPIPIPDGNAILTLRVNGHDGIFKDWDGWHGTPDNHWIEIRGGGSTDPVLARLNSYEDTLRNFTIDARGYSTLTVIGVDNGDTWVGMDDIDVNSTEPHDLITNGSLEDGFNGWTVTGSSFQVIAKSKPGWETIPQYASEGGLFASGYMSPNQTGTVTSPPITVTRDALTFDATGYSGGPWGGGNNEFRLLDASMNVIASIKGNTIAQGTLVNGVWQKRSFNLLAAGLSYGDTCYFQAYDGDVQASYDWIGFDNVRLTDAGPVVPGIYDNFESGTYIDSGKWKTIDPAWGLETIYTGSTRVAWSNPYGTSATGNLVSYPILIPENGGLTIKVSGHDVPDKDGDGFKPAPEALWVEVRGGSSTGPVLAKMNAYENTLHPFKVDARGYDMLTVIGVDNGNAWVAMDDIATTSGVSHELVTNGSVENGFTGWTVTGTAWQTFAKTKPSWESAPRYPAEGGMYATTYETESLMGSVTSAPITVKHNLLVFDAAGYSGGPWGGGNNKFNLLDSNHNIIATINGNIGAQGIVQGGTWVEKSFDLFAAGLDYNDTCYFQAVDGDTGSYGWIAFDNIRQETRKITGALEQSMNLAGQNLLNSLRPSTDGYLPYAFLTVNSDYTARFDPSMEIHNIGRVWDALLRLENATGFTIPADVNAGLFSTTQQWFNNPDNLCWAPQDWLGLISHQFELHSFRENALALASLAEFRNSTWAKDKAPLLAATLSNATDMGDLTGPDYQWIFGNFWYYNQPGVTLYTSRFADPVGSNGRLIEALVYLYQATGNTSVFNLAGQYAAWHLANSTNANGTLKEAVGLDHTHSYMCTMRGLLLYGELIGGTTGQQYINNVAATYGVSIRNNRIKESGWNPHDWNGINNAEAASAADSAQIACILGRLGHDEYLDDAERLVRCLILPCQINDTDMASHSLTPDYQGDQNSNPDRYTNLTQRNIGGYGGMHNMNGAGSPYGGKQCTTDITASVLHSLVEIYNNIAVHDSNGLKINFHFDYEDDNVSIISKREEYTATVTAQVKITDANVLIRIPQWAPANSIVLSVNGSPISLVKVGNFARISAQSVPMEIKLKYGLPVRTTFEKPNPSGTAYQFLWQGDEIAGINPNTDFLPFYQTLTYPPFLTPEYRIRNVSDLGRMPIDTIPTNDTKYDWGGSVIKDGSTYRMWWCRQETYDTIYYADSSDGVSWHNTQKVLQAADNDSEKMHVGRPSVVKVGGTFYMFYESPRVVSGGEVENQIFLATSTNGTTWAKYPSNSNPQPIIALGSYQGCGTYGLGQPSVFYKDGQFNIYYVCNVSDYPDKIRMAKSADPYNWGSFTSHEVVAYGAGVDVKWNSELGRYVMAYTIGDWITPNPSGQDTYNMYVFTSSDGKVWNGYTTPYLYQICRNATDVTLTGFTSPNTRGYANLVSTDQYGCMNSSAMKAVFMQGNMHVVPGDWRTEAASWNLHSLSFKLGQWALVSDINGDGTVDMKDLAMMTNKWLSAGTVGSIPEDIAPQPSGDGVVNFLDFALFAEDWLMTD